MTLKLKLVALALAASAIFGMLYASYQYVKQQGALEAKAECEQQFKEYQNKVAERLETLESSLSTISGSLSQQNQQLSRNIGQVLQRVKKPEYVTVVKDGNCTLSQEFLKDLNSAIDAVNSQRAAK